MEKLLKEIFENSVEIKQVSKSATRVVYEIDIKNTLKDMYESFGDNLNTNNINPCTKFELEAEYGPTKKDINYTLFYKSTEIVQTTKDIEVCSAFSEVGSEIITDAQKHIINEAIKDIDKVVKEKKNCLFYDLPEDVYHDSVGLSKSKLCKIIDRTYAHYEYHLETPMKDTKALSFGRAFHSYILTPEIFKKRFFVTPKLDLRKSEDKKISIRNRLTKSHLEHLTEEQMAQIETMANNIFNHPIIPLLLSNSKKEVSIYWENNFGEISRGRIDAFIENPNAELKRQLKKLVPDYRGQKIIWDLKTEESDASIDAYSKKVLKYHTHVQGAYYTDGVSKIADGEEVIFILVVIEKAAPNCVAWYKLGDASIDKGREEYLEALDRIYNTKGWKSYSLECQILDIPWFSRSKAA